LRKIYVSGRVSKVEIFAEKLKDYGAYESIRPSIKVEVLGLRSMIPAVI